MKLTAKYVLMGTIFLAIVVLIGRIAIHLKNQKAYQPPPVEFPQKTTLTTTTDSMAGFTIKNVVLKEFEKSKAYEITVNAEECKFFQTSNLIECLRVTCTLLDHKREAAHIKTDTATIKQADQSIFFGGTVLCQFKDLFLTGMDITYNYSNQTLLTNKTTTYRHQAFTMTAHQSFIDIKQNKFVLSGNVINEFSYCPTGNNNR